MTPKVFLSGKAVITSVIRVPGDDINLGKITIEFTWLDNNHNYDEIDKLSNQKFKGYEFTLLGEELGDNKK